MHIHHQTTNKLGIGFSVFLLLLTLQLHSAMAKMSDTKGLKIRLNEDQALDKNKVQIDGHFSTFVTCGSQYATWHQFPETINYTIKDLKTGETYQSIDNTLSISWDGNEVYEEYSNKPCDQIISEDFSVYIEDVYFIEAPENLIENFELTAEYFGYKSNTIVVNNSKLKLKKF